MTCRLLLADKPHSYRRQVILLFDRVVTIESLICPQVTSRRETGK
jgi:hypothetical protein